MLNLKSGVATLADLTDGLAVGTVPAGVETVYYVDNATGDDQDDGDTWDNAKATIQSAITASNATVDWSATPKRYNVIYVKPGVYAEELTPAYYCHIIGCGLPGTDTQAEIHPTTGSCLTGTLLGARLVNLWFETNEAVDCLNIGICNNSVIEHCVFTNGAAVAATALSTDNCTHLTFRYNRVESGQTTGMAYGLYFQGGADKYAHNVEVYGNTIFASTAGIWIEDTCTASQAKIYNNFIARPTKGIDDNNGGSYCWGNFISASSDAIEHANSSTQCIGNYVINNATAAFESAHAT